MEEKIYALAPIIDQQSKVLILGSIPSQQSLEKQEYYGNKRNHFWSILSTIFNQGEMGDYQEKLAFLHHKKIALWDAIGSCYRTGSLDSKIRDAEPNQLDALLEKYPNIRMVACNGTKSFQTFKKHFPHLLASDRLEVKKLPSTSPIPGRYNKTFEEKVEIWKDIFDEIP